MRKVLFVCLGNICRSPLAEALFMKHVRERGLENKYGADSCGTSAYHLGDPPDSRSLANARKNGLDYTHQARQIRDSDFSEFDLIVPMDASNKAHLEMLQPDHSPPVRLMRDFDPGHEGSDVPDPYFGGSHGFQEVYDILDRATARLLDKLENDEV